MTDGFLSRSPALSRLQYGGSDIVLSRWDGPRERCSPL